jgi:peptidoglycan/LPS O-acetylase OafA/YrhL
MEIKPIEKRLWYLDNLKLFLTIIVIIHHVGQAYGPTGGFWQYKSSLPDAPVEWLGRTFGINAAYFMGLFFLISGYFFPGSYDRKGARAFLRDKIVRLGIPLIAALLIISPLQMYSYYMLYSENPPLNYWNYFTDIYLGIHGMPEGFRMSLVFPELNFGHLWFVEHLLVYAVLYTVWRLLFGKGVLKTEDRRFTGVHLLCLAVLIAVLTTVVRIEYPIDRWIGLFGFIQMEVAHVPQYLILFLTGMIAFRKNWFSRISSGTGYVSLGLGAFMAFCAYTGFPVPRREIFRFWSVYDSFMCVCLCWGLLVLFREKLNITGTFLSAVTRSSYGAYIFHYPIVLLIQHAFDRVPMGGLGVKYMVVSLISVPVTYCLSWLLVKNRVLRNVL